MKNLVLTAKLDIAESLRSRWFMVYTLVFGGLVALLFVFGLTESRILGFTGLSRLLLTYIQLCIGLGSISGNSLQGGSHCLPAVEWEVQSNPLPEGTDNGYHRDRYTLLS